MRTTTKKSSVTGKGRISGVFPLRVICALSGVHFHVFASLPSQNTHTHTQPKTNGGNNAFLSPLSCQTDVKTASMCGYSTLSALHLLVVEK
jgi:hypothetical protein